MKVYMITGCTGGLGLALHEQLVNMAVQDRFIFLGRNLSRINRCNKFSYWEADLSAPLDFADFLGHVDSEVSDVVYINNAAQIQPICRVGSATPSEMSLSLQVNFFTPVLFVSSLYAWAALNNIKLTVFNVSSGAAETSIPGWSMYCSTKSALKHYFDVLAKEDRSVNVIHYDPGVVDTAMQAEIRASTQSQFPGVQVFRDMKAIGKLKSPSIVASEILSLLEVEL